MNIRNLIATAAVGFALIAGAGYAFSQDRPDGSECEGQVSILTENLSASHGRLDVLSDEETASIVSQKGPPPVEGAYHFGLAQDQEGTTGMFIIYDGDCIKFHVGPSPMGVINKFLGRVTASNG